jgi:type I restriction enzyme R subunit
MDTEADTCRTLITPKLQAAGWENEPHSITEQRAFALPNVAEIIGKFGGADQLRNAVNQLQSVLYAA